jgi:hypothetical protein
MSVEFFEDQRREMVAAIRAITKDAFAQVGKPALDARVLRAMAKAANTLHCARINTEPRCNLASQLFGATE